LIPLDVGADDPFHSLPSFRFHGIPFI
jgi:hypothetical protein